ncbi:dipicolinate synthase subunit A [Alicyclobacillus cellulosilyticus]|uniref:Dipicolinate synthase subunit A n=1 Tax=Alicyclobacillus cellulosilyticus TaxID=1003997 RepID=A0A917NKJ0_9BACL|nr:dipicolinate synthase subunit DpsA [Alicyclobacillus cellulosilyticus]GGJ04684.1 dipicolinate synthase subunit A [Alicyclobacillus cellulosilyticus]
MLTGRRIVFLGGDARQLEVVALATEWDASAVLIGFDKVERTFPDTVKAELDPDVFRQADAVILPVAGMDDDGRVESQFRDAPLVLGSEHFAAMRPGTMVFTGIARPLLEERCAAHGLNLIKLMELDEVAILNSIPTAEGAIALAMQYTDITIHGAKAVVLGFGRCGQTLARVLAAMGARVRVGARQAAHIARIVEMGLEPFPLSGIERAVADADVVFNTIPHLVLHAGVLAGMPRECVIIDIASKPGGTDFRYAERRGMKAILAPSLPGLVAPKTAGRIIANTVCRMLAEAES